MAPHRVFLLRHAKSSRDDPDLADHDRPLAPRGRKATALLRSHIEASDIAPELVLCSSAVRAVQTLEGIRDALPPNARIETDGAIYGASPSILLRRLRGLEEEVGTVMMIGHNPAIELLGSRLAGGGDERARERMRRKYPTGGLATIGYDGSWWDLGWGAGRLEGFVVPRELD